MLEEPKSWSKTIIERLPKRYQEAAQLTPKEFGRLRLLLREMIVTGGRGHFTPMGIANVVDLRRAWRGGNRCSEYLWRQRSRTSLAGRFGDCYFIVPLASGRVNF